MLIEVFLFMIYPLVLDVLKVADKPSVAAGAIVIVGVQRGTTATELAECKIMPSLLPNRFLCKKKNRRGGWPKSCSPSIPRITRKIVNLDQAKVVASNFLPGFHVDH